MRLVEIDELWKKKLDDKKMVAAEVAAEAEVERLEAEVAAAKAVMEAKKAARLKLNEELKALKEEKKAMVPL
jgi:hypothetical protein